MAQPATYRIDTGVLTVTADGDWWNAFNDPVLTAMVEAALRNNYDARIASANRDATNHAEVEVTAPDALEVECWDRNTRCTSTPDAWTVPSDAERPACLSRA